MGSKVPPEFLLDNSLDEDTKAFLLPLVCLQNASFQPKYRIRHGFITPNSWATYVIVVLGFAIFNASIYLSSFYFNQANPVFDQAFEHIKDPYDYTLFALNLMLILTNVMNTKNNVKIILKLQSAKRAIHFTQKSFMQLTRMNWLRFGCFSLHFTLAVMLLVYVLGIKWFIYVGLNYYNILILFTTQIYAIGLIQLLTVLMKKWIDEMKICVKTSEIPTEAINRDKWRWKILFKAYCDILESFDVLKKASVFTILLFTLACFLMILGCVQNGVQFERIILVKPSFNFTLTVSNYTISTFALKYYVLSCILSTECEKLCMAVNLVNVECLLALKMPSNSVDQKRVLKNVLRVNRHHFTKVNPFSIFTVDGSLPLKLASFCTTYAVVLLQFQIL